MSGDKLSQFIGTHLNDCYAELRQIGALGTWAPFCLDIPSLKGVEARFNNHWGDLIIPSAVEFMVTVTDGDGLITHSEVVPLGDMQSGVFQLRPFSGQTTLGAIYFGCVSPEIHSWVADQKESIDYFYLAYESVGSYSLVHSQPFDVASRVNASGWPACIEVLAAESPRILMGNPSIAPSSGDISFLRSGAGLQKYHTSLNPFQVKVFDLNVIPDGWYTMRCAVAKNYSSLVRSYRDMVFARHL